MKKIPAKVLFGLGMLLLFGSWISESYFKEKWASEIAFFKRMQTEIIREVSRRDTWLIGKLPGKCILLRASKS